MNTPNYISQNNNQTSVLLRPMYERMGFAARHFPEWIDLRIKNLSLVEGKDFRTYTADRHVQYEAPLAVALSILATVPKTKAEPVKQDLSGILTTSTQPEQIQAQNEPVAASVPEVGQLFLSSAVNSPSPRFSGPVPVMQIEGKAAVNAKDLFQLWNSIESRSLSGWMNYRIESRGLIAGKHYAEFDVPAAPGHRRGHTGYILSIDAAILIADSEPKGKGKEVAAYLIEYRKDLAKQKLPNKAKLSDFIGMQPANVAAFETRDVQEDSSGDTFEVSGLGGGPELIHTQSGENSGEGLFAQNGKNSTNGINDNNVNESDEEVSPETVENPNTALDEVFTQNGNNPEELSQEQDPNLYNLIVKFAQGLLQQAQGMAELYRQVLSTSGTVSELVKTEQQAALRKLGLYPGKAAIPAMTLRDKINHAVSKRAGVTGEKHEDIFKMIYARLANDYGYSVLDFERKKGQSHLQLCEELGIISIVWDIVNGAAFNRYASAAPKATA